ncbi:LamG-like jellyroll fold domain-containing protein [Gemmata sp.]|uniref:LamG-like jellyroll fold domain-containing protein n=1 Tax=Gemmata sp. TaxID=1914242 RepID=UPI003F7059C4
MTVPPPLTALEAALARYLDGEPEPGDADAIARALEGAPDPARELSGLLALDDLLRQEAEPRREAFVEAFEARVRAEGTGDAFVRRVGAALATPGPTRPRPARWVPWAVALAACLVAVLGWWPTAPGPRPAPPGAEPEARPPADGPLAALVNGAGVRFADRRGPTGSGFGPGRYDLVEGTAHLRFRGGADVVVAAPAAFVVEDGPRLRLEGGALRAVVPEAARGFVVAAPGVRFRDTGAEFGAAVDAGGACELHVFEGPVEVLPDDAPAPAATVAAGEAVRITAGTTRPIGPARPDAFPTAAGVSFGRWEAWREEFRRDPDLVLYYPFVPDPADPARLVDAAAGGAGITGRVERAAWVAGRWPGKRALQFENPGDGVALTVPGEYDQLTLAAWLKIDRSDAVVSAVLDSDGWHPGAVHWQFDRRRTLAPTALFSAPRRSVVWSGYTLPVGRWAHWAVTMDRRSGRLLHYVDGVLACETRVAPGTTLIRPGACHLGRWVAAPHPPEDRGFRGRIDELAVWRAALPPGRVAELAAAGRPVEPVEAPPRAP